MVISGSGDAGTFAGLCFSRQAGSFHWLKWKLSLIHSLPSVGRQARNQCRKVLAGILEWARVAVAEVAMLAGLAVLLSASAHKISRTAASPRDRARAAAQQVF